MKLQSYLIIQTKSCQLAFWKKSLIQSIFYYTTEFCYDFRYSIREFWHFSRLWGWNISLLYSIGL